MAYSIEEEQEINLLKDWWKDNGKVIIVAFILGIVGVLGWRFWQSYQANQIAEASTRYSDMVDFAQQDHQSGKADSLSQFVQAHEKSTYAVFALLDDAKKAVNRQDYSGAEKSLKQALSQSQDTILTSLAALRLSLVQLQTGQFDTALESLNLIKGSSFGAQKALLVGDIQLAKGDKNAAKISFEQVVESGGALERQIAQMKLNNL